MASGYPQVDSVTGYPMVDAATGYPIVTNASDVCCCGSGGSVTKNCYQQWQATFDCIAGTWGATTSVQKKCLATGTNTLWFQTSKTATTCTYKRWVDTGTPCTTDADCAALGDTANPGNPGAVYDCCQTCCGGGGGCCFSAFSTWTGNMPHITWTGDPTDAASIADVAWYNSTVAGSVTIQTTTSDCFFQWIYTVSDPPRSFEVIIFPGGASSVSWDIVTSSGAAWDFVLTGNTQTCCSISGGHWVCTDNAFIGFTPSLIRFLIDRNYCCTNEFTPFGHCEKLPGTCDGRCNVLP